MNNILIALDESTVSTGYSIFKEDKLINFGILAPKSKSSIERVSEIAYGVEDLISKYKVSEMVIENINITMSAPTAKVLMGLELILEIIAYRNNIKCTSLRTTSWRKILGLSNSPKIKRPEKKKETMEYVKNKYGIDTKIDDIADSIAIGTAYLINNGGK